MSSCNFCLVTLVKPKTTDKRVGILIEIIYLKVFHKINKMGKSKSIEEFEKEDKKNREYLSQIGEELSDDLGDVYEKLNIQSEIFYKSEHSTPWESDLYIAGEQFDYQSVKEWSLASVQTMINKISEAVIGTVVGEETNLPEGTTTAKDTNEINRKADMTKDKRLLVAVNCFNLLSGIVGSFGNAGAVGVQQAYQTAPIGGGLRIFGTVGTKSFQRSSFFKNEIICTYQFSYVVKFSLQEFRLQAEMGLIDQYQRTLNITHIAADRLDDKFMNGEISYEQWISQSENYENNIKDVLVKIDELEKEKQLEKSNGLEGRNELSRTLDLIKNIELACVVSRNKYAGNQKMESAITRREEMYSNIKESLITEVI